MPDMANDSENLLMHCYQSYCTHLQSSCLRALYQPWKELPVYPSARPLLPETLAESVLSSRQVTQILCQMQRISSTESMN
jgi:hypothetical protein